MFNTLSEYYIDRNIKIMKAFAEWKDKGKTHRDAYELLAKEFETSKGLINAVVLDPNYSWVPEAQEKIKEELKALEEKGAEISPSLAKLVSYEPVNPKLVPN